MTKSADQVQLGDRVFDPVSGEVRGPDGAQALRPQTARVLALLAERAGTLVTKAELIDRVWAETHVTDDSLVQCISEIRKALRGASGVALRTLPKKGYRLEIAGAAPDADAPGPGARPQRGARIALALVVIVAALAGAVLWLTRPTVPDRQITVAVLPFLNMSGDDGQSYFSNGLAEDLIVDLSGLSDLRVISRAASFSLDPAAQSLQEIAGLLRADYVIEGSVRRLDDSLRISAALVDAETGVNAWAERYEGAPDDVFAFQDDVVAALVRTLSVRLSAEERGRLGVRGTRDIAAHDAYLRGRALENLYTKETNLAAEAALLEAIRIDPDYALPHAHLAQVYSFRVENNWTEARDRTIRAAFDSGERAVALDPALPFAHFSLGRLYTRSFAPDQARAAAEYETALALDPNYDDAYVFLANVHIFNGRAEAALPMVAEAFARNPLPPYWYFLAEGMARYFLGDYAAAEAALVTARDQNPTAPYPYRFLIATYGRLGNTDDADWMAMEYEALGRTATVADLLESASIQHPAYRDAFAEGFRAAGLPES